MPKVKIRDKDMGMRRIFEAAYALSGKPHAKVGILADTEKGGMHHPGNALTVAEIAAIMEYGTENEDVPARPFVRPAFDQQIEENVKLAAACLGKIIDGKMKTEQALNILGARQAAETKKYVTSGPPIPPPNAPAVARRKEAKGSSSGGVRTLVDTSRMVNAITWGLVMGVLGPKKGGKHGK